MAEQLQILSDIERQQLEDEHAAEHNKVDLMVRRNMGMIAILYWMRDSGVTTLYVEDERTNSSAEFEIPPKGCLREWRHAFAHPDANLDSYLQTRNGEDDGA